MGRIMIKQIKYEGDKYYYFNNNFNNGLNILLGENANGKSTFTYLIIYALGGKVPYFEKDCKEPISAILDDTNNYVELTLMINNKVYVLNRKIGSNYISIYDKSKEEYISLNLNRTGYFYEKEGRTFSDWILDNIGINLVEINQHSTTHRVNFDDLMRLMYYDQKTENEKIISEFAINTSNFYKNGIVMRRTIFEILISEFFKEYYDTYFYLKEILKDKEEKVQKKNAIVELIQNLSRNIGYTSDDKVLNKLEKSKKELSRLINIRKDINSENSFEDSVVFRLTELQKETVSLITEKNSLKGYIEEINEDLNKALIVRENLKNDIKHLEKILFTSQYINIINEGKCPFCQEDLHIDNKKCICGSDKYLDYQRFIYSDKEYTNIMKSKIRGLKTANESIEYCEKEKQNMINRYKELEEQIYRNMYNIKQITEGANLNMNTAALDEITENIIRLKEEISGLEILKEKYDELAEVSRDIENVDQLIETYKKKLDELEEEKQRKIENNLIEFEEIYEKYLKSYYKGDIVNKISLDRNYMPIIGVYKEQSFNVPKRFFYYLSLLKLSIDKHINFPRFLIIDTLKSEGIDIENLKKITSYFNEFKDVECQIILTSGYEEHIKEFDKYVIERLTDSNKLLKKK